MCDSDVRLVVGDRFSNFKNISTCVSYQEWKNIVGSQTFIEDAYIFIPGLGLSVNQICEISKRLPFQFREHADYAIANQSQTHKHNVENIVITTPKITAYGTYESKLIVQDNNELILDHTTGYHLPGMIFLEATRQMATSVVDLLFNDKNKYYVMHDIVAEYLNFAFPVETTILLELIHTSSDADANEFSVSLHFIQNGKKVVATGGRFSAVDKLNFSSKEGRMAEITTTRICKKIAKQNNIKMNDKQKEKMI